jgi:anti-anti-sigma factor
MLTATNRTFIVDRVRNVTVICFTVATLNEDNFASVADELQSLIHPRGPRRVVFDLASIRLIDDLGLAMLQSFHDGVEEYGGTAILCRLSPAVASAVSDAGLLRQLHIRHSRNEAVWTF